MGEKKSNDNKLPTKTNGQSSVKPPEMSPIDDKAELCANCKYFVKSMDMAAQLGNQMGNCMRFPPQMTAVSFPDMATRQIQIQKGCDFPIVAPNSFCGEFIRKVNA